MGCLKLSYWEENYFVKSDAGKQEYQYHLKDHLGNTRVMFTTKNEQESNTATLETANAVIEQSKFLRYETARKIQSSLLDHTNGAATGYAQRLNGTANEKYGLAKSISVMPGDTVKLEVYAKYIDTNNGNWTQALTNFLSAIANGTAPEGTAVTYENYSSSTSSFTYAGLLNTSGSSGLGPKAYLNWLIFDRDYNFVNGGYQRMTDAAREYGQDVAHEKLSASITITQPGYVYVYLSNEETSPVEVYFDDMNVTHIQSPIISMDDFTPFGITFNSFRREGSLENRYLYNQGTGDKTFLTERIFDLDLNVDFTKFRTYDPAIGRWWQVDPLADEGDLVSLTPYNYAFNNPVLYSDPYGDCPGGCKNLLSNIGAGLKKAGQTLVSGDTYKSIGKGLQQYGNALMSPLNKLMSSIPKDQSTPQAKDGTTVTITGDGPLRPNASNLPKASDPSKNQHVDEALIDAAGTLTKGGAPGARGSNEGGPTKGGQPTPTMQPGEAAAGAAGSGSGAVVISGAMKETGGNTTPVTVKSINDTIYNSRNFIQIQVTTTSGKDSVVQVSKTPDNQ